MVRDNEILAAFFDKLESWNQAEEAMDEIGRMLSRSRRRSAVGALHRCLVGHWARWVWGVVVVGGMARLSSLDSSKHNCNKPCGTTAATGRVTTGRKGARGYSRLYCKSWSCRYCGPKKAARIRERIVAESEGAWPDSIPDADTRSEHSTGARSSVRYIRDVWRKFRVSLKRKLGKSVSFISVVELHKSGCPHLHALVDQYIPQAWISDAWSSLGGGRVVYIERVKDLRKIGWYLGKYLTKEMLLSPAGASRRYSSSRNIKLGSFEKCGWRPAKYTMETLYRSAKNRIVHEVLDENGHVKSFMVAEEVVDVRPCEAERGEDKK